MKIFADMWNRLFKHGGKGAAPAVQKPPVKVATAAAPKTAPAAAPTPAPPPVIDVEAVLESLAAAATQKLNWRTSIVDLMKLLDMDSSLTARKALADELGFDGDKSDSAKLNIWLHKEVIRAFAHNGGSVPANLLD